MSNGFANSAEKLRALGLFLITMVTPLAFLLIICPLVVVITSAQSLKDTKNVDLWDYDEANNLEKVRCNVDNEICKNDMENGNKFGLVEGFIKRRPNQSHAASTLAAAIDSKKAKIIPFYHSSHPMPCSCGMELRLLDMGPLYYPRYIHTGVCKTEGCGGVSKCLEKHYRVRVLRQRNLSGPDSVESMTLPESLRDFWQSETVRVTVACECSL